MSRHTVHGTKKFSIHALREEGDARQFLINLFERFYPRPPRGGRRGCAHGLPLRKISIHALREEGDLSSR